MSNKHIAVIGAGIAGLALARELSSAGARVTVFDKSRGVGGRMSTRRGEGWMCDHGAQYFTASRGEFRDEVLNWQNAGVVALWQPRLRVFDECAVRDTRGEHLRYVGTPGMSAAARHIAEGLDVRLQSTIVSIDRVGQTYHLTTAEEGLVETDFFSVALALPAPQVSPLVARLAEPLAMVANAARMQPCWAIMLRLAHPLKIDFDAAFVNRGPLSWVARNSSKPERCGIETWLLHAGPDWSQAHVEDSPDAVASELIKAFVELGADIVPQAWSAHRWRYAFTDSSVNGACVWDHSMRLGMCGDWLNGGKVEGAWLSGRALAQKMLER